ncbi:hypothetical protein BKA67DRAFT_653368 [Truncatella angustata]|uniref:Uncharacterized protein n=1 Tax=Truncatella angustata TaxID=152316 RepID=A0A9P9A375_9PEZI|nr:uncharacterized protein BKA67DRAFT_653368 [Truncatella angustata]KAH6660167.1 hypothetical protein BKA67DRAFT_653368 [Truncatella angustata]KAH8201036.1 hypothetical protein TruAng_004809 [Truncatella angustata]
MTNPQDVEILIHIAAPSKASDDARYRSLAAAYIHFHPQKRHNISSTESSGQEKTIIPATTHTASVASQDPISQQLIGSDECFSSFRSFQASFDSVIDNVGSPTNAAQWQTPGPQRLKAGKNELQSSWKTPPSVVQDSVPENDATTALLTTPTRVLEHYLQNFTTPSQASQRISGEGNRSLVQNLTSYTASSDQKLPGQGANNHLLPTIPCTPGNKPLQVASSVELGETSSDLRVDRPGNDAANGTQVPTSDDEVVEDTVIIYEPETPQIIRADSEPPPTKRLRQDNPDASSVAPTRTASGIGPHKIPNGSTRTITFLPVHGYGYNSLELNPPDPPAGCASVLPDDLITPGLQKLAADLKLSQRYKPELTAREIRPFERGYWTLDCTDWPQDLKTETWVFLANYIGTGVSGWGVSCKRDEQFTCVRLYCWGCLVAHIYLLIWLASRRRVSYSGATWIDGEGKVVIAMGRRQGTWIRM